jgi:hypothetical protein
LVRSEPDAGAWQMLTIRSNFGVITLSCIFLFLSIPGILGIPKLSD